jgi:hypothetical protein
LARRKRQHRWQATDRAVDFLINKQQGGFAGDPSSQLTWRLPAQVRATFCDRSSSEFASHAIVAASNELGTVVRRKTAIPAKEGVATETRQTAF